MLEGQQQLRPIGKQQFDVRPREIHNYFRIFHFGMRIRARPQLVFEIEAGVPEKGLKKLIQLRPQRIDRVFHAIYFFEALLTGALVVGGGAGGVGWGMNLLIMSCCAIPIKLLAK